jgi:hypothetical protein
MNRLAGLNLRYQSLRSTIRQEQIQLTHLRKHDSRLFTCGGAGATSANNAAPNAIKAGWPIVPIAKNVRLGGRKLHIRCHAGITSRPKRQLQFGISLARIGSGFLGPSRPTQEIFHGQ